jgi:fatty acid desaturase
VAELAETFVPYFALTAVMIVSAVREHPWATLALAPPAALFLVRIFIVFHDPMVLQWFTGSIGLHHIHHVQPRIPFYNLQRCQDAIPAFQAVPPLTLRRSLESLRLRLVDETDRRMVGWPAAPGGATSEQPGTLR